MPIVAIQGNLGSGKTLFGNSFLMHLANKHKTNFFTNYPVNIEKMNLMFPNIKWYQINNYLDLQLIVEHGGGFMMFDEMQMILDSRLFGNNVFMSQLTMFLRKFNTTLFYTSQHISFIDIRVRKVTDYVIDCQNKNDRHIYTIYKYMEDMPSKKLRRQKVYKKDLVPFYGLYDTKAIIFPLDFPKKQEQFTEFLKHMDTLNRLPSGERIDLLA